MTTMAAVACSLLIFFLPEARKHIVDYIAGSCQLSKMTCCFFFKQRGWSAEENLKFSEKQTFTEIISINISPLLPLNIH